MKIDEINKYDRHEYWKTCDCGHEQLILTQKDSYPEYKTEVYVKCPKCEEYIQFDLPVN